MKQNTATVASMGFDKGKITLKNTSNVLAPSICAASSSSVEWKNKLYEQIKKLIEC